MDSSLEKPFMTLDIWEHIFDYLSLKEQLKLTEVCQLFHHVITFYIWKRKYKELKLCLINEDKFIVTDRIDNIDSYYDVTDPMYKLGYNDYKIIDVDNRCSVHLNYNEVLKFLANTANNIVKLQIIEKENIQIFNILMKHQFEKLKTLIVDGGYELNLDIVKGIKLTCPLIETLIVSYDNEIINEHGILKDHNQINELCDMKMLKTLFVTDEYFTYNIKEVLWIISKLQHLQQLVLNINIKKSNFDNANDLIIFNKQINLYELNIKFNFLPSIFTNHFIHNFQHLKVLSLGSSNTLLKINREFMEVLRKTCKLLKSFSLEFCEFEEFITLPSLETFKLINCTNLKHEDLKSILSLANLQSFTSIFSRFSDSIKEPFYITSPLEHLHIETCEYDYRIDLARLLQYNSKNMNQLKTLIWHDYTMWFDDDEDEIGLYLPLKDSYHNIHSLSIDLNVVDFDDIMKMDSLKELTLIENDFSIDLNTILNNIVNNPKLETFKYYTQNLKYTIEVPIIELSNYKTRLHQIQIPFDMFVKAQYIWLRLLAENSKLQISCYFYPANSIDIYKYIKNLLKSKKLPERIKSFKIKQFTIDCRSFQENANAVKVIISEVQVYSKKFKEMIYFKF